MAKKRGRGWSAVIYKTGMFRIQDASAAFVQVKQDGSVVVMIGSVEVGSGTLTTMAQIAAEELGVPLDSVTVVAGDTDTTPYDSGVVASRSTYITGSAVQAAARDVKRLLFETAAEDWGVEVKDLECRKGWIYERANPERRAAFGGVAFRTQFVRRVVTIGTGSFQPPTGQLKFVGGREGWKRDANVLDPESGQGDPIGSYSYTSVMAEVEVDSETGVVDVLHLTIATDCGRAINPMMVEGQMEGGLAMGLGYGLYEDSRVAIEDGRKTVTSLMDYHIPTTLDVPEMTTIIVECPEPSGPFGAKGMGEITSIPAAPAICNAIHDAVGVRITSLPATPDKVLAGILARSR